MAIRVAETMRKKHALPTIDEICLQGEAGSGLEKLGRIAMLKVFTGAGKTNTEAIHRKHLELLESDSYGLVMTPDIAYSGRNARGLLFPREMNEYLSELLTASENSDTLMVPGSFLHVDARGIYNEALVIYRGRVIHRQLKQMRIRDAAIKNVEHPSFIFDNFEMGVEICSNAGSLARAGHRSIEILFLVTSGVFDKKYMDSDEESALTAVNQTTGCGCVAPGGLVLINDGKIPGYFIGQIQGNRKLRVLSTNFYKM